jgi:arylsulfatase A-like enzyme
VKNKILAGSLIVAFVCATGSRAENTKPNIILLMADDLGWGDVGYNGNKIIQTPHLDQMAKEGIRFDRFYSASAVCSPTRASCLIGRNPFRTGVFNANNGILRPEEITLPEVLKEQGYTTGHFGKWHLGTFSTEIKDANRGGAAHPELYNPPSKHGTDLYFATESKVPTCDPMLKPAKHASHFGWDAIRPGEATKPFGTHYWSNASGQNEAVNDPLRGDDSKIIMDHALAFVEKAVENKKPFLSVIWFHAPHKPCVAAPEFAEIYKDQEMEMRNFAGCITGLDASVGRLRKKLQELGVAENTMIWFCSDNGPENNAPGSTGGFRERKRSLHEGGVRVPGLLVWPAKIKMGRVEKSACVTSDYLPTIMAAVGIPRSRVPYQLDGENLMPLIEGKSFARSHPIFFQYSGQLACSADRYKFYQKNGQPELYDLQADPSEKTNLAAAMPEKTEEMMARWRIWQAATKASFEGKEYGTASFNRVPQKWIDVTKAKARKPKK